METQAMTDLQRAEAQVASDMKALARVSVPSAVPPEFTPEHTEDSAATEAVSADTVEATESADAPAQDSVEKPEETTADDTQETQDAAEQAVTNAGLDIDVLTQEYNDTGTLSEASYKALADAGIPKDVVDRYIAGQEAVAQQVVNTVQGYAGGKEGWDKLVDWAGKNLSAGEIEAFNRTMESTDMAAIKMVVEGVKARMPRTASSEPKIVSGKTAVPVAPITGFKSTAELLAASDDPRYKTDPEYRMSIEARMARSAFL